MTEGNKFLGEQAVSLFYRPESEPNHVFDQDFGENSRKYVKDLGATLLTRKEANDIWFQGLFDLLCAEMDHCWPHYECLPLFDYINVPLPFNPEEHFEKFIDGKSISSLVEQQVNANFHAQKYLFAASPMECVAISFETFSYELLQSVSYAASASFVLFDENLNQCFIFDDLLYLTVYSRSRELAKLQFCEKPDAHWVDYFNANCIEGMLPREQESFDIMNRIHIPRLPGVKKLAFTDG